MQFITDSAKNYLILLVPLIVVLLGNKSIIHGFLLSVFCLLYAAGTPDLTLGVYFKNYYNMVIVIFLFPVLTLENVFLVATIFEQYPFLDSGTHNRIFLSCKNKFEYLCSFG